MESRGWSRERFSLINAVQMSVRFETVLSGPALEGMGKTPHELEREVDFIFTVASWKTVFVLPAPHSKLRLSQHHTMMSRTHEHMKCKETATPQVAGAEKLFFYSPEYAWLAGWNLTCVVFR